MFGLDGTVSLFAGAVALGLVHGAEPGHGWPVAAAYALEREHRWFHGFAASFLLGLGHLVSSIAVVAVFFLATDYFEVTELGWVRYVAGVLLIALGVREYRHGHSHGDGLSHGSDDDGHDGGREHSHDGGSEHSHDDGHAHSHDHEHDGGSEHSHDDGHAHSHDHEHDGGHGHDDGHDHVHGTGHRDGGHEHGDHSHDHGDEHAESDPDAGILTRVTNALPVVGGGDDHGHAHLSAEDVDREGLVGIVGTAFVLGFAHEEEFEIIGLCLGSTYCLELMLAYALAVLVALVALTLLLLAGFQRYGERVERYADHLPTVSAVVLVALGIGFILGVV